MASRSVSQKRAAQWPPEVWPPIGSPGIVLPGSDDIWLPGDGDPGVELDDEMAGYANLPTSALGIAAGLLVSGLVDNGQTSWHPLVDDPVGWITRDLGEFMWSKQREIAESVRDHRRTAVPSAHETGKSWLAARIVSWWLSTHKPGEAFVVTTAPTGSQVRAILWREINRAHRKGNLPGRTNQTEWWINEELVAFGRKPADYDPSAFQGIHAKFVLVILDEACGVPVDIYQAANSLIANEYGRMLAIGNPDDPASHFATVCLPGSGWNVIHVSAFDTPNLTGEPIPDELRPLLTSRIYIDEQARDVGEDSPVYISKVLGNFPENSQSGVVPLSMVRACQQMERDWGTHQVVPVELGVDVGAGGDETVIRERRGAVAGRNWRYTTPDSSLAVGYVMRAIKETGATCVKVDIIGIGWGVVGRLKELRRQGKHSARIIGVNVGAGATDPTRFVKLRDQIWWEIGRELSRTKAWDLSAVDDTTVAQLIAPTWAPDSAGRAVIEPKRLTKKRLLRSPDDADALLLAYYTPPKSLRFSGRAGGDRVVAAPIAAQETPVQRATPRRAAPRRGNRPLVLPSRGDPARLPNPYRRRRVG